MSKSISSVRTHCNSTQRTGHMRQFSSMKLRDHFRAKSGIGVKFTLAIAIVCHSQSTQSFCLQGNAPGLKDIRPFFIFVDFFIFCFLLILLHLWSFPRMVHVAGNHNNENSARPYPSHIGLVNICKINI